MKLSVQDIKGKPVGEVELADAVLCSDKGGQAVFEAVVGARANARAGTASTKHKGEVSGSGKKPWKQKGSGRARAGYKQSNVWRGGYAAFGPKPRSYRKDMPRKMARLAFKRAVTDRIAAGEVLVIDDLALEAPKTKQVAGMLKDLGAVRGALLVLEAKNDNAILAARNIPRVEVTTAQLVNTYQFLRYQRVVITKAGLEKLVERMA